MSAPDLDKLTEPIPLRVRGFKADLSADSETTPDGRAYWHEKPVDILSETPNLVSSLCVDGKHRPALDIDVPVRVIPSSTGDHWHLYFPTVELDAEQYWKLLDALVEAGIVGYGFAYHSKRRGASWLRLPGVKKEKSFPGSVPLPFEEET